MTKNIGDMNRSELIDYIIELDEENRRLCKKLSFKEKCRRKEERSLMKKIDNLSKGNKWLLNETEFQQSKACEYKLRIDNAIEYIENPRHEMSVHTYQGLLEILDKVEEK